MPLKSGAVNEEARGGVVAGLSRSLSEQSVTTAGLLDQPAPQAAPVVAPPVLSLTTK